LKTSQKQELEAGKEAVNPFLTEYDENKIYSFKELMENKQADIEPICFEMVDDK